MDDDDRIKIKNQLLKLGLAQAKAFKVLRRNKVQLIPEIYVYLVNETEIKFIVNVRIGTKKVTKSFGSLEEAKQYRKILDAKKQAAKNAFEANKLGLASAKAKIKEMKLPVGIIAYPKVDGSIGYIPSLKIKGKTRNFGAQNSLEEAVELRRQKAKEFGIKPKSEASRKQQEINLGKNDEGIATNLFNDHVRADNTTGYRGVTRQGKRFKAYLTVNGVRYYSGTFETAKEAYYNGRLPLEEEHLNFKPKKKG